MTKYETITVNDAGVELGYIDSGPPSTKSPYITIIAIHGMCFSAPIFKRVQAAASHSGVRFVALNRRNYPASTPLTPEESGVILNGTKEQKDIWLMNRGHDLGMFIDKFIRKAGIPSISGDGRTGGITLLGWSAGCCQLNAAIAHADTLPSSVRSRLSAHIRSLVFHEPHGVHLGFSVPEYEYTPLLVPAIPNEYKSAMFSQWVACYFEHGDLSTRDHKVLSWVVPSTVKVCTMYNIPKDEQTDILCYRPGTELEPLFMLNFREQLDATYRKAFYGEETKKLFPKLKISHIVGSLGPAFAIASLWNVEKDAKETGKTINTKIVPGANHFLHWDEPEKALAVYLECA